MTTIKNILLSAQLLDIVTDIVKNSISMDQCAELLEANGFGVAEYEHHLFLYTTISEIKTCEIEWERRDEFTLSCGTRMVTMIASMMCIATAQKYIAGAGAYYENYTDRMTGIKMLTDRLLKEGRGEENAYFNETDALVILETLEVVKSQSNLSQKAMATLTYNTFLRQFLNHNNEVYVQNQDYTYTV